ncbi:MAG: hypothetical protein ACRDY1_14230, partial [Acidimicrobiales bacterium]
MSVFAHHAQGVELDDIEEPLEWRHRYRRELDEGIDPRSGLGAGRGIGAVVWERWGGVLEPLGMDADAFTVVLAGAGRELWLWVMGERQWDEVLAGLAGRVRRRLPAP